MQNPKDLSNHYYFTCCVVCLAMAIAASLGCSGGEKSTGDPSQAKSAKSQADKAESDKPFVLGDLIEPFDPPSLEELEAEVEWVDSPVLDGLELLRELQAEQESLATVDEALSMKNDSPEANAKIRNALGRVRVDPKSGPDGKLYGDEQGVDYSAELVGHAIQDINSSNPILSNSIQEGIISDLTAFGLFSFDGKFKPFASKDAVSRWQSSKDGLYDKVILRDDLVWSDGKPITAHDVAFSFKAILSSQVPIPAMRTGTDQIKWVEAYDDRTLVYFHKQALATNVWNLNFQVIPKHVYENSLAEDPTLERSKYHVKLEDAPVLGGPYTITKRSRGQEIVLGRRENYYMHDGKQVRDKPFLKSIRYKVIPDDNVALLAMKKGDIQEMRLTPFQWRSQTGDKDFYAKNTKVQFTRWLTWSFQYNFKTPFFSDVRVRKAMGYAFNHKEMLERIRYGLDLPAIGTYHPDSPWCPDPPPKPMQQDLAKARALLKEAGWNDTDGDGVLDKEIDGQVVPFEFSLSCRNEQWRLDTANLLAENLEQIGVICNVRGLEATVIMTDLLNHRFQAAFGGWSTGADPSTSQNIFGTDEGRNFGFYSNPEVDRLFKEAKLETDYERRRELYGKIHNLMWEDQPYTWLFHESGFHAFNKNLRGYNFSPRGPFSFSPGAGSIYRPAAL